MKANKRQKPRTKQQAVNGSGEGRSVTFTPSKVTREVNGLCLNCTRPFKGASVNKRYCSGSCKTLAARARKQAAVDAVRMLLDFHISEAKVRDVLEMYWQRVKDVLTRLGWWYDEIRKVWLQRKAVA